MRVSSVEIPGKAAIYATLFGVLNARQPAVRPHLTAAVARSWHRVFAAKAGLYYRLRTLVRAATVPLLGRAWIRS